MMMSSCWQLVAISALVEGFGSLAVLYCLFQISNVIPLFFVYWDPGDTFPLTCVSYVTLLSPLLTHSSLFLLSAMMSLSCLHISSLFFPPPVPVCSLHIPVTFLNTMLSSLLLRHHISDKCR